MNVASPVMLWVALALSLLCSSGVARAAPSPPSPIARFALVLGNDRPEGKGVELLRYADDDALQMHLLLREAAVDSRLLVTLDAETRALFPETRPDGPATAAALDQQASELFAKIREANARDLSTELAIFFSGHGDVDAGEGYLVLEGARLTRARLYELLRRSPAATNHVFIDACRSYFMVFERGRSGTRVPYTGQFSSEGSPAGLENTGFVLSTSSDRESHEWERYQGGILSHELRSALRGAADADLDQHITYAELAAFLQVANSEIRSARFRPDFLVSAPTGNQRKDLLNWDSQASATVTNGLAVHFYVETLRGERLLDAHPAIGQTLALWLPAQRPLFVRTHDEKLELELVTSDEREIRRLLPSKLPFTRKGSVHQAFGQLFSAPFSLQSVLSYRPPMPFSLLADRGGSSGVESVQTVAGWIAAGAAAAGSGIAAASFGTYLAGEGASNAKVARLNRRVHRLNVLSAICFATAGAAGLAWASLEWLSPATNLESDDDLAGAGGDVSLRFEISGTF